MLTTDIMDRDGFLRWLDRHNPDVVIGFVSRVMDWIQQSGRRVPEDIAFASLAVLADQSVNASGVVRHVNDIGSTGVDALVAAIHENEWGVPALQRKLLLEPVWHEGETLPERS
ncbi:hypothetical protein [Synoicihabitans lomoniglobus]|uniref:Uncharacterized protein n=1 Tax=Synoicihabitans lomoniglobus TaxID=2909285 RepID=A0AAE9ZZ50_9BACT|nr:hypothetical protein [Opitutaceae bacterium LMO-M01]WED63157.1 hypothetical protein PXH66_12535 [Opitutaceae bacterium LMO-M01]